MKRVLGAGILKFLPSNGTNTTASNLPTGADVRDEEYANAFRTESYNEFWARVLALSNGDSSPGHLAESTSAARLPSYRLFAEHLLDPDQTTVVRVLDMAHIRPSIRTLLSKYFVATANASFLCGSLLKDIDQTRANYSSLKTTFKSLDANQVLLENHFSVIVPQLTEFANSPNASDCSATSPSRVRVTQTDCSELLKQLELLRDEAKVKLRVKSKLKHCSALLLVVLTASLTVIVVTHALALLVATPGFMMASLHEQVSTRRLSRRVAQLDAATKGTYILIKDLETTSRLVARLNDELEHMRETIRFWLERGLDWLQANWIEVMLQLKNTDSSFGQQLDDLEEHLYLCFMTINKARNLVIKEINMDPGPDHQG